MDRLRDYGVKAYQPYVELPLNFRWHVKDDTFEWTGSNGIGSFP